MPLDGILVGTAAMATLEATTAPEVKQLLVDTRGTHAGRLVGAGSAKGGMASGRSQLGADIHEIDNTASRTGRLLDEVAGDAKAVAARRDEIIEALNRTAKPYFGDVETMTYAQWLRRYLELSGPHRPPPPPLARRHDPRPLPRDAAARRGPPQRCDRGTIPTLFADARSTTVPPPSPRFSRRTPTPRRSCFTRRTCCSSSSSAAAGQAGQLRARARPGRTPLVALGLAVAGARPALRRRRGLRHPRPGLRRRHRPRRRAGRRAAAPLRGRHDRRAARLPRAAALAATAAARRGRRTLLALVLAAPDLVWAGRTVRNPVHRLGAEWVIVDPSCAARAVTGAALVAASPSAGAAAAAHRAVQVADGVLPVVSTDVAAGDVLARRRCCRWRRPAVDGRATVNVDLVPT